MKKKIKYDLKWNILWNTNQFIYINNALLFIEIMPLFKHWFNVHIMFIVKSDIGK